MPSDGDPMIDWRRGLFSLQATNYFFLNLWPAKHLRKDLLCIQKPIYQVYSQLILAAIKGKGETKVK